MLTAGGGSWSSISDSTAKDYCPVNALAILEKIAGLNVYKWNYGSWNDDFRYLGFMAQGFDAQFGMGENNAKITTVEADGVIMAAIQELAKWLREVCGENLDCGLVRGHSKQIGSNAQSDRISLQVAAYPQPFVQTIAYA